MKTKHIISIATALSISMIPSTFAQKPGTLKPGKGKAKTVVAAKSADLHTNFDTAKKAFAAGNMKASSAAISEAATMVTQQQVTADKAHAAPLGKASASLTALAKSVGEGKVKDAKTLDNTFAVTHQTLAEFYQGKAQRAYDAGEKTVAAKAMEAAANHVENGAKWAGTTLSDTAKGTVGLLRKVSGGILSGAGTGVEKIGDVLGKGTKTITNIGSKIRGEGAAPDANVGEKAVKGTQGVAGGAVETTGKVTEKGTDAVKGAGKGLKGLGDKVAGKKKEETTTEVPKKDQ